MISLIVLTACTTAETEYLALEIEEDYQGRIDEQFYKYKSFGVFDPINEDINSPVVKELEVVISMPMKMVTIGRL